MAIVEGPVPGDEFQVNTTFTGQQALPQAAMNSGGESVVVWLDESTGFSTPRVMAQRFDAGGAAVGSEIVVGTNVNVIGPQVNSRVAMSDSGEFVVVWTHLTTLFGRVFNADGTARTSAFQIDDSVRQYDVAIDADGDFGVVFWEAPEGFTAQHPGFETRVALYNENAALKGSVVAVSPIADSRISWPQIGMDADGDFVVGYISSTNIYYEGGSLLAQRFNAAGARQGTTIAVSALPSRIFDVDMNAVGDFALAFTGNAQSHTWGMNAVRYNAAGVQQTPVITFGDDSRPNIALADDGDFAVVWTRSTGEPDWIDVYAQRFFADGTPQTAVFRANQFSTLFQNNPHIAGSGVGEFLIVWEDWEAQDGSHHGIFARRFGVGTNEMAVAIDDAFTLEPNATLTVSINAGVLANDRDSDGDGSLSDFDHDGTPDVSDADDDNDGINDAADGLVGRAQAELLSGPTHGTLYFHKDGSFVYAAAEGYLGADTFTYRVVEPNGTFSDPATVNITVAAVTGQSTYSADNLIVSTRGAAESGDRNFPQWATFIPGPAGPYSPSFTVSNVSKPALFSVLPAVAADGTLTFQLAAGQSGRTTFDVTLDDGASEIDIQTFSINVGKVAGYGPTLENGILDFNWRDPRAQSLEVFGSALPNRSVEVFVRGSLGDFRIWGVTGSLHLNSIGTGGGGDTIELYNLNLAGRLHINSGDGDDHLKIGLRGAVSSLFEISLFTGDGSNQLDCLRLYGASTAQVQGGFGSDRFHFYDPSAPGVFVLSMSASGFTNIHTGGGDDELIMRYGFFPRDLSLSVELGNNYLELFGSAISGSTNLFAHQGTSTLVCNANYLPGGLRMSTPYGSGRLILGNCIIPADVTLATFDGSNRYTQFSSTIDVENTRAGTVTIRGNQGIEAVDVRSSLLDELYADLGDGSDQLVLFGNQIESTLDLDGGPGTDRLVDMGGDYPPANSRRNWEVFV